jgi:hypothetical protein
LFVPSLAAELSSGVRDVGATVDAELCVGIARATAVTTKAFAARVAAAVSVIKRRFGIPPLRVCCRTLLRSTIRNDPRYSEVIG